MIYLIDIYIYDLYDIFDMYDIHIYDIIYIKIRYQESGRFSINSTSKIQPIPAEATFSSMKVSTCCFHLGN